MYEDVYSMSELIYVLYIQYVQGCICSLANSIYFVSTKLYVTKM